ncbi:MAG: dTDP-4-dehydrorhamnose 3,5-epimerase family protein, partial [Candidatus Aquilonibacter sp.]
MEVTRLPIDGAFEIVPRVFADERGYFKETYAASRYLAAGIDQPFVQDNLSLSQRFVLRGLHTDPRMAKIVQVLTGSAYDVIVDVRRESPS